MSKVFLDIRLQFLNVYSWDSLMDEGFSRNLMCAGNEAAHHGNAATDAYLYEIDLGSDESLSF